MVTVWHHHKVTEHSGWLCFLHCHGESPEAADKLMSKQRLKRQWPVYASTGNGWISTSQEGESGIVRDRGWNDVRGLEMEECLPGIQRSLDRITCTIKTDKN